MILVQNLLQLLNGNKIRVTTLLSLLAVMLACSKKHLPVQQVAAVDTVISVTQTDSAFLDRYTELASTGVGCISLILPFDLQRVNFKKATLQEITQRQIALGFYEGFTIGLDSAAKRYQKSFKLHVYDEGRGVKDLQKLTQRDVFKKSDLVIGPIFEHNIKAISAYSKLYRIPIISPLLTTSIDTYNNPNQITVNAPVNVHARRIARYVVAHLKGIKKVYLVTAQIPEHPRFLLELKKALDSFSLKTIRVMEIDPQKLVSRDSMSRIGNVFVIASSKKQLITSVIGNLHKEFKQGDIVYPIHIFGHPNWRNITFSNLQQMQDLNVRITANDVLDVNDIDRQRFVNLFRKKYELAPNGYAYRGFDIGLCFGNLIAQYGANWVFKIDSLRYQGLYQYFQFVRNADYGYYNNSVHLLRYRNFKLERELE